MSPKKKKAPPPSDFLVSKQRVGKKKLAPTNETRTEFSSKSLRVPVQPSLLSKGAEATTSKGHGLPELLSHVKHHNANVRSAAFEGLREIGTSHPSVLSRHLAAVVEETGPAALDVEAKVRKAYRVFLLWLCNPEKREEIEEGTQGGPQEKEPQHFAAASSSSASSSEVVEGARSNRSKLALDILPFAFSLTAYLRSALTHVRDEVRSDGLALVRQLLERRPELLAEGGTATALFGLVLKNAERERDGSHGRVAAGIGGGGGVAGGGSGTRVSSSGVQGGRRRGVDDPIRVMMRLFELIRHGGHRGGFGKRDVERRGAHSSEGNRFSFSFFGETWGRSELEGEEQNIEQGARMVASHSPACQPDFSRGGQMGDFADGVDGSGGGLPSSWCVRTIHLCLQMLMELETKRKSSLIFDDLGEWVGVGTDSNKPTGGWSSETLSITGGGSLPFSSSSSGGMTETGMRIQSLCVRLIGTAFDSLDARARRIGRDGAVKVGLTDALLTDLFFNVALRFAGGEGTAAAGSILESSKGSSDSMREDLTFCGSRLMVSLARHVVDFRESWGQPDASGGGWKGKGKTGRKARQASIGLVGGDSLGIVGVYRGVLSYFRGLTKHLVAQSEAGRRRERRLLEDDEGAGGIRIGGRREDRGLRGLCDVQLDGDCNSPEGRLMQIVETLGHLQRLVFTPTQRQKTDERWESLQQLFVLVVAEGCGAGLTEEFGLSVGAGGVGGRRKGGRELASLSDQGGERARGGGGNPFSSLAAVHGWKRKEGQEQGQGGSSRGGERRGEDLEETGGGRARGADPNANLVGGSASSLEGRIGEVSEKVGRTEPSAFGVEEEEETGCGGGLLSPVWVLAGHATMLPSGGDKRVQTIPDMTTPYSLRCLLLLAQCLDVDLREVDGPADLLQFASLLCGPWGSGSLGGRGMCRARKAESVGAGEGHTGEDVAMKGAATTTAAEAGQAVNPSDLSLCLPRDHLADARAGFLTALSRLLVFCGLGNVGLWEVKTVAEVDRLLSIERNQEICRAALDLFRKALQGPFAVRLSSERDLDALRMAALRVVRIITGTGGSDFVGDATGRAVTFSFAPCIRLCVDFLPVLDETLKRRWGVALVSKSRAIDLVEGLGRAVVVAACRNKKRDAEILLFSLSDFLDMLWDGRLNSSSCRPKRASVCDALNNFARSVLQAGGQSGVQPGSPGNRYLGGVLGASVAMASSLRRYFLSEEVQRAKASDPCALQGPMPIPFRSPSAELRWGSELCAELFCLLPGSFEMLEEAGEGEGDDEGSAERKRKKRTVEGEVVGNKRLENRKMGLTEDILPILFLAKLVICAETARRTIGGINASLVTEGPYDFPPADFSAVGIEAGRVQSTRADALSFVSNPGPDREMSRSCESTQQRQTRTQTLQVGGERVLHTDSGRRVAGDTARDQTGLHGESGSTERERGQNEFSVSEKFRIDFTSSVAGRVFHLLREWLRKFKGQGVVAGLTSEGSAVQRGIDCFFVPRIGNQENPPVDALKLLRDLDSYLDGFSFVSSPRGLPVPSESLSLAAKLGAFIMYKLCGGAAAYSSDPSVGISDGSPGSGAKETGNEPPLSLPLCEAGRRRERLTETFLWFYAFVLQGAVKELAACLGEAEESEDARPCWDWSHVQHRVDKLCLASVVFWSDFLCVMVLLRKRDKEIPLHPGRGVTVSTAEMEEKAGADVVERLQTEMRCLSEERRRLGLLEQGLMNLHVRLGYEAGAVALLNGHQQGQQQAPSQFVEDCAVGREALLERAQRVEGERRRIDESVRKVSAALEKERERQRRAKRKHGEEGAVSEEREEQWGSSFREDAAGGDSGLTAGVIKTSAQDQISSIGMYLKTSVVPAYSEALDGLKGEKQFETAMKNAEATQGSHGENLFMAMRKVRKSQKWVEFFSSMHL